MEDALLEGGQLGWGDAAGEVDAMPDLLQGGDGGALLAGFPAEDGKGYGL